jgi:hypothetical protein
MCLSWSNEFEESGLSMPLPCRPERRLCLVEAIGHAAVRPTATAHARLRQALVGVAAGDPAPIMTRVFGE